MTTICRNLRLSAELWADAQAAARAQHRTCNSYVQYAVGEQIKRDREAGARAWIAERRRAIAEG
jgi:hypothetical protein